MPQPKRKDISISTADRWLDDYLKDIVQAILPPPYLSPAEWAERNILFSRPADPIKGFMDFRNSPYLREPVNAWECTTDGTKELTLVAPEQMGKTLFWLCGLLWSLVYRPGVSLIYYTSDDKSALVNTTKLLPMLEQIPRFERAINRPNAKNKTQYRLGDNLINFGGVGSRISSITSSVNVADEVDDWLETRGKDSLQDLRKRSRTYKQAVLAKVCTPKGTASQSRIWREFLNSSQGYYHLRCQGCGELTMRACDIHNLQFELAEQTDKHIHADPIADSIRLVCPKCGFEHSEDKHRYGMIQQGGYIHRFPARIDLNAGWQVGQLASLFSSGRWLSIATAQTRAGSTGKEADQLYFDNSVRGLPYNFRKSNDPAIKALHIHAIPLASALQTEDSKRRIRWRFFAADTQDDCFYWVVRGLDALQNSYLLACGRAESLDELNAAIRADYHGGGIRCAIIDEGGHRQDEVRSIATAGIYTYKGGTCHGQPHRRSESFPRLLLGNAQHWQLELLRKLYATANPGSHYWYTTEEAMTDDYKKQLTCYHADTGKLGGDELENYVRDSDSPDHFFDAEKMCLMLMSYAWEASIMPELRRAVHVR